MGIGKLRCAVVNVTDLDVAYEFWSQLTGLEVIGPPDGWHGWLGYLGTRDPWKHEIILQRVTYAPVEAGSPSHDTTTPVHLDIEPNEGVDRPFHRSGRLLSDLTLRGSDRPKERQTLSRRSGEFLAERIWQP